MEDFESIKENTAKSLRENEINTSQMKDWKLGMRKTLLDVRQQFVDWIDNFTNKFIKSLSKIEQSKELLEFQNEDSKLEREVSDMRGKYFEILKIFHNIANAEAKDKLDRIESERTNMRRIELEVDQRDKKIKKQAAKLKKALRETVDLNGLDQKIMSKYLRFLQQKVNAKIDDETKPL